MEECFEGIPEVYFNEAMALYESATAKAIEEIDKEQQEAQSRVIQIKNGPDRLTDVISPYLERKLKAESEMYCTYILPVVLKHIPIKIPEVKAYYMKRFQGNPKLPHMTSACKRRSMANFESTFEHLKALKAGELQREMDSSAATNSKFSTENRFKTIHMLLIALGIVIAAGVGYFNYMKSSPVAPAAPKAP